MERSERRIKNLLLSGGSFHNFSSDDRKLLSRLIIKTGKEMDGSNSDDGSILVHSTVSEMLGNLLLNFFFTCLSVFELYYYSN